MEDPVRMAREDALEEAARVLDATASDYDEMARRKQYEYGRAHGSSLFRPVIRAEAQALDEKARLLRGQANHIRNLKAK